VGLVVVGTAVGVKVAHVRTLRCTVGARVGGALAALASLTTGLGGGVTSSTQIALRQSAFSTHCRPGAH
jgi:hypothetical protein